MQKYELLLGEFIKDFSRDGDSFGNSIYFSRHLDELGYFDFAQANQYSLGGVINFVKLLIDKIGKNGKKRFYITLYLYIDNDTDFLDYKIPNISCLNLNTSFTPPEIALITTNKNIEDYRYDRSVEKYSKPIYEYSLPFDCDYIVNYNCGRNEESIKNNEEYSKYFTIDFFI